MIIRGGGRALIKKSACQMQEIRHKKQDDGHDSFKLLGLKCWALSCFAFYPALLLPSHTHTHTEIDKDIDNTKQTQVHVDIRASRSRKKFLLSISARFLQERRSNVWKRGPRGFHKPKVSLWTSISADLTPALRAGGQLSTFGACFGCGSCVYG